MKSSPQSFLLALLVTPLLAQSTMSGCKPQEDHHRITATLDRDGYALFEVDPNTPGRAAALVEMRDAPTGTYVLLHSLRSPTSVGWFALDVAEYKACTVQPSQLDCLVPDGRGEVVSLVTITPDQARTEPTDTTLLRHELPAHPIDTSTNPPLPRPSEWYAVMRVEKGTPPPAATEPFAFEVRQLDAATTTDTFTPKVKQVK
jgi:hypothetical protein